MSLITFCRVTPGLPGSNSNLFSFSVNFANSGFSYDKKAKWEIGTSLLYSPWELHSLQLRNTAIVKTLCAFGVCFMTLVWGFKYLLWWEILASQLGAKQLDNGLQSMCPCSYPLLKFWSGCISFLLIVVTFFMVLLSRLETSKLQKNIFKMLKKWVTNWMDCRAKSWF